MKKNNVIQEYCSIKNIFRDICIFSFKKKNFKIYVFIKWRAKLEQLYTYIYIKVINIALKIFHITYIMKKKKKYCKLTLLIRRFIRFRSLINFISTFSPRSGTFSLTRCDDLFNSNFDSLQQPHSNDHCQRDHERHPSLHDAQEDADCCELDAGNSNPNPASWNDEFVAQVEVIIICMFIETCLERFTEESSTVSIRALKIRQLEKFVCVFMSLLIRQQQYQSHYIAIQVSKQADTNLQDHI